MTDPDWLHRDARIDAYIAKAESFARPILEHVRAVVHEGCPDVEETIKWGHAELRACGRDPVRDGSLQATCLVRILEAFRSHR